MSASPRSARVGSLRASTRPDLLSQPIERTGASSARVGAHATALFSNGVRWNSMGDPHAISRVACKLERPLLCAIPLTRQVWKGSGGSN
jgi:hypothetical protein